MHSLKVTGQGHLLELRTSLKYFLIKHKGLYMHVAFMIPRFILEISKFPVDILFLLLFKLLVSLLFGSDVNNCYPLSQAALMFNSCLWLFLTDAHREKVISLGSSVKSNTDSLVNGVCSRESLGKSNNNSLGWGFWRNSNPILLFPMAARLMVSTVIVCCSF